MDVIYKRVAGLDVHKETLVATVRVIGDGKAERECRTFETPTAGLSALSSSHHLGRATFPAPASSNAARGFPVVRSPVCSPQGLWGLSCRSGFRRWSNHSVAIEQLQSLVRRKRASC